MGSTRGFHTLAALVVLALGAVIAGVIIFGEPRGLSVAEVSPPDGATDVPRATQVTVTFSRPLDEASGRAGLMIAPSTDGFVSVAGRRAAFTPRFGFRGDTAYRVTLGRGIRDRGGHPLAREVVSRFHTQPLGLVLRTADDELVRARFGLGAEPLASARVGQFAVSAAGRIAYVRPEEAVLVVEGEWRGPARRIALPAGFDVRELEWAPGDHALLLLGATGRGVGAPYLVRLDAATPAVEVFGPRTGGIDPRSPLVTEALKKSLVEIVYERETFAFTPDGRAAIVRDQNWDFAILGFNGARRGNLGPFLAVGNAAPGGDALAVVDVNPADPALPRQVLVHGADGRSRLLSAPESDSHSPRFAHQSDRVVFATASATGLPRERRYALEVVDLPSGARRRLTNPPAGQSDEAPRWSPDDAWISFRRAPIGAPHRGVAWVVPADGGPARPLTPAAADTRWSP